VSDSAVRAFLTNRGLDPSDANAQARARDELRTLEAQRLVKIAVKYDKHRRRHGP